MVPVGFLVISPQLANLMVEWLWSERKTKNDRYFPLLPVTIGEASSMRNGLMIKREESHAV
jgi:hypothetical protein